MQPASKRALAQRYASCSDGELLALAAEKETLTAEAQSALADEMAKRDLTDNDVREYYDAQRDEGPEELLPPEVEYVRRRTPSVYDNMSAAELEATAPMYRDQLLTAAKWRVQRAFFWAFVPLLASAAGTLTYYDFNRLAGAASIGSAVCVVLAMSFTGRLSRYRCPRCQERVKYRAQSELRCPKCWLRIYPVDD